MPSKRLRHRSLRKRRFKRALPSLPEPSKTITFWKAGSLCQGSGWTLPLAATTRHPVFEDTRLPGLLEKSRQLASCRHEKAKAGVGKMYEPTKFKKGTILADSQKRLRAEF